RSALCGLAQQDRHAAARNGYGVLHVSGPCISYSLDMGCRRVPGRDVRSGIPVVEDIAPGAAGRNSDDATLKRVLYGHSGTCSRANPGAGLLRHSSFRTTERSTIFRAGLRDGPTLARPNAVRIPQTELLRV